MVALRLWPDWLSSNVRRKLTFLFSVFINIVFNFMTFSPRTVDIVKCP